MPPLPPPATQPEASLPDASPTPSQADGSTADQGDDGGKVSKSKKKREKEKQVLQEQIRRMSQSSCYVWIMLLLVSVLFMMTFIMMKLFPKRKLTAPPAAALHPALHDAHGDHDEKRRSTRRRHLDRHC